MERMLDGLKDEIRDLNHFYLYTATTTSQLTKSQQTTTQPQQWTTCVYVGTGHPYYRPAANNIQYTYFLRPSPVDIIILRCVGHRPLAELLLLQPTSQLLHSFGSPPNVYMPCHTLFYARLNISQR